MKAGERELVVLLDEEVQEERGGAVEKDLVLEKVGARSVAMGDYEALFQELVEAAVKGEELGKVEADEILWQEAREGAVLQNNLDIGMEDSPKEEEEEGG